MVFLFFANAKKLKRAGDFPYREVWNSVVLRCDKSPARFFLEVSYVT